MLFRFKWLTIGYLGLNHFLSYVMLSYHSARACLAQRLGKKNRHDHSKKSTISQSSDNIYGPQHLQH
jgi:hypothetical protein